MFVKKEKDTKQPKRVYAADTYALSVYWYSTQNDTRHTKMLELLNDQRCYRSLCLSRKDINFFSYPSGSLEYAQACTAFLTLKKSFFAG